MDALTIAEIASFQKNTAVLAVSNDVINPGGLTPKQVTRASILHSAHCSFTTTTNGTVATLKTASLKIANSSIDLVFSKCATC